MGEVWGSAGKAISHSLLSFTSTFFVFHPYYPLTGENGVAYPVAAFYSLFSFRYFPLLKCPIAPTNRSPLLSPDSEMHQLPLFLIQGRRKSKIKTKANANIYESSVQLSTAATTVTRSTTKRHFVFFSTFPLSTHSPLLFPCSSLPILAVVCWLPIVIAACLEVLAPGGKGRHEEGSVGTCLVKVQVALGQNVLLYHCTDE